MAVVGSNHRRNTVDALADTPAGPFPSDSKDHHGYPCRRRVRKESGSDRRRGNADTALRPGPVAADIRSDSRGHR